jgi:hypothetical protein
VAQHLTECRERIERAKAHLEALYAERESSKAGHQEWVIEYDSDTSWHIFRTKYFDPPPLKLGVIASDYIHQLRATLDNFVCALAELNGTPCTRDHAFPTTLKQSDWPGAVSGRLKGLRADHVDEIASVQPYTATYDPVNHPFAALDALSRLDKHRFLTPTPLAFADSTPEIVVRKPGISIKDVRFVPGTPLERDREFLRVRVKPDDPDPDMNLKGHLTVYVSFGQRPINERSLERIGACVEELINRPIFQS